MKNLTNEELSNVNGGAIRIVAGKVLLGGGILTFIVGVISGYLRPLSCSSSK